MLKNPFGLRDGSIVTIEDISESERGKKCGCVCPSCGAALIARKGEEREHHFAHDPNHPCDERIAMMISSYTLLKEALDEKGEFCYPGTWWNQRTGAFDSKMRTDAYKQLHHSNIVQIKDTDLRKSSAGIPEALVVTEGEKEHQFAIRLLFPTTVCGQQESEKKYEEYSTLVIDLTDTKTGDGWTVQKWKKFYCDDNEYKKWVWNTKIEEKKKELEKERKKILKQEEKRRMYKEKEHSREPRHTTRKIDRNVIQGEQKNLNVEEKKTQKTVENDEKTYICSICGREKKKIEMAMYGGIGNKQDICSECGRNMK